eukprot:m.337340 g.337340  ORF g.337340 m.337340 type:complete len:231 (-) comp18104_c0_seq1:126-818(-)
MWIVPGEHTQILQLQHGQDLINFAQSAANEKAMSDFQRAMLQNTLHFNPFQQHNLPQIQTQVPEGFQNNGANWEVARAKAQQLQESTRKIMEEINAQSEVRRYKGDEKILVNKTKDGLFKCLHCGKTTPRKSDHIKHQRIHTQSRPYACQYPSCGKRFSDASTRSRHMQSHNPENHFKCKYPGCDKVYTRKCNMLRHFKSHSSCSDADQMQMEDGETRKSSKQLHSNTTD